MKPLVAEWVSKAEGDFAIVERESRARKNPSYDGICFHAQQCAEKYLKARLCEAGGHVEKMHDLPALLEKILPVEPLWESYRTDLAYLSDFAVLFRYPGESADHATALRARFLCQGSNSRCHPCSFRHDIQQHAGSSKSKTGVWRDESP